MKKHLFSLRFSIPLILFLVFFMMSVYHFKAEIRFFYAMAEEEMSAHALFEGTQTAIILEHFILTDEMKSAEQVLTRAAEDSDLNLALLIDEGETILLSTRLELKGGKLSDTPANVAAKLVEEARNAMVKQEDFSPDRLTHMIMAPINIGGHPGELRPRRIGVLYMEHDLTTDKNLGYNQGVRKFFEDTAVLGIICLGLWFFFERIITTRIKRLVAANNRLAEGDLNVRLDLRGRDELASLSQSFDKMVEGIRENTRALEDSEEKVRLLLDSTAEAIFGLDLEGNCSFVNSAFLETLGYQDTGKFIGRNIHALIHHTRKDGTPYPEDECKIYQAHKKGKSVNVDDELLWRADGSSFPVEYWSYPILRNGKIEGSVVTFLDITQRRRDEENLAERARHAEIVAEVGMALTEGGPMRGVLQSCMNTVVRHLSASFARVWVFNKEENMLELKASAGMYTHINGRHSRIPLGKLKIGLIAKESRPHFTNFVQDDPLISDREWAKQRGIVSFAGHPLIVEDQLVGVLGMFSQNTLSRAAITAFGAVADEIALGIMHKQSVEELARERANLEETVEARTRDLSASLKKLVDTNLRLVEANRAKSRFLSTMSHELRTPLNAILGFTDLLGGQFFGQLNEKQLSYVEQIDKSGKHLLAQINDLLDIAKIDSGSLEVELEMNSPEDFIGSTVYMMESQFKKKNITTECSIDPDLALLAVDSRKCKQIMFNLLSNALKYTPGGGKVVVRAFKEGNARMRVEVRDTGIGIEPDEIDKIFLEFYQADRVRDQQLGGTGIGLSLTRRLVELHGGEIGVKSEPGLGSVFWFTMPLKTLKPLSKKPGEEDGPMAESPGGNTILVAEDNNVNLAMIIEMLKVNGHKVLVARNGQEALEAVRKQKPELILMDIRMPVMDGLEATRRLRMDPGNDSIPIIALTASAGIEAEEKHISTGCDEHLSKPVQSAELNAVLAKYLGKKKRS